MYTVQSTVGKNIFQCRQPWHSKLLWLQKHCHNSCVYKLLSCIDTFENHFLNCIQSLKTKVLKKNKKQLGVKVHSSIASLSVSQVAIDDLSSPAAVKLLLSPLSSCATCFENLVLLYRAALSPRLPVRCLGLPYRPAFTALPCCLKVKAKRNRRKHCRSREFCSLFDRNLEGRDQRQRSGECLEIQERLRLC